AIVVSGNRWASGDCVVAEHAPVLWTLGDVLAGGDRGCRGDEDLLGRVGAPGRGPHDGGPGERGEDRFHLREPFGTGADLDHADLAVLVARPPTEQAAA